MPFVGKGREQDEFDLAAGLAEGGGHLPGQPGREIRIILRIDPEGGHPGGAPGQATGLDQLMRRTVLERAGTAPAGEVNHAPDPRQSLAGQDQRGETAAGVARQHQTFRVNAGQGRHILRGGPQVPGRFQPGGIKMGVITETLAFGVISLGMAVAAAHGDHHRESHADEFPALGVIAETLPHSLLGVSGGAVAEDHQRKGAGPRRPEQSRLQGETLDAAGPGDGHGNADDLLVQRH